jgi:CDP-4-dehydro-6-deoxyglucose reductase
MIARLISVRALSPEVKHFVFEAPEAASLDFAPGQFVSFVNEVNGRPVTRAYSLAAPPDGNRFELCLNLVEGGLFSPVLFALRPGDVVNFNGILGTFTLRPPVRDTIFVATGTGIAPFRGMLMDAFARKLTPSFTLIFGARYEHGLVFAGEFRAMEQAQPNFRFVPAVTRPSASWTGRTGRVQPLLLETIGERRDLDVYLCGMKAMIDETRQQLKALGFDRKQIIVEKYD